MSLFLDCSAAFDTFPAVLSSSYSILWERHCMGQHLWRICWQHIDCDPCVDLQYKLFPVYEHSTLRLWALFSWCQWVQPGVTTVIVFVRPIVVTYIEHTSLVLVSRLLVSAAPFHALPFTKILGHTIIANLSISGAHLFIWSVTHADRQTRLGRRP